MVRLGVAWERVAGGEVPVRCWEIDGVREENLVVDVDVLLNGLVWIQGSELALDNGLCPRCSSLQEVCIHLLDRSLLLDPLHHILSRELADNLILFIPVAHLFGVVAEERGYCLTQIICI